MAKLYRFKSRLATQDRLRVFPVPSLEEGEKYFAPSFKMYEQLFDTVPCGIDGVQQFRAPIHFDGQFHLGLQFDSLPDDNGNIAFDLAAQLKVLPDIWSVQNNLVISEKTKKIIEACDPDVHGYLPVNWLTPSREAIDTPAPYYWFHPSRFLTIAPSEIVSSEELGFFAIEQEEDFLGRLVSSPELQEQLQAFPVWRHYRLEGIAGRHSTARMVVYFNKTLAQQMLDAELTGFVLADSFPQTFSDEASVCILPKEGV